MPLTYRDRGSSGTQLDVVCGNLIIATLYKSHLSVVASQAVQWRWTFRVTAGPPGFEHNGTANTFEQAKSAVERNWQAWLAEAKLREA